MTQVLRSLLVSALLAGLIAATALASNTGKIVGKVTDASTGEALIGVNVLVVGTTRGAVSDVDGKFTIIGVPIGNYTVEARQVGYAPLRYEGVKVGADQTTELNYKLNSSAVDITGVTVTAQSLVNSLAVNSQTEVGSKTIEAMPNVKGVEDVLKYQPGVVKQGNNLYLRGGRANEVVYLVDGMPSNNVVGNSGELSDPNATIQNYQASQTGVIGGGASGLAVSASAIEQLSVEASNFDADYGNAQSGIISITTKSGGDKYSASALYRTDKLSNDNQNETYSSFSLSGPEPISKYILPGLGTKLPGSLTFIITADVNRADGPYNFSPNDFYNPLQRKVQFNGLLGGIMNGLGFQFRDNQKNTFTLSTKLRYDPGKNDQFSYRYSASLGSRHDFNNSFKYFADSSALSATLSIQHNFTWQHFFNEKSFFKLLVGKQENHDGNDVAGISPADYSPAYKAEYQDLNGDGFADLGTTQRWYSSLTNVYSLRFDFNSQIHPLHLLKSGFEFNYEEIRSTEIVYPTVAHTDTNGNLFNPPDPNPLYSRGDYPGFGTYRWHTNVYPNRGGAYLQDNIEFSGLNFHVGIRYDYLDVGKQVFDQNFIDAWRIASGARFNPGFEPQWAERVKDANGNPTNEFVRMKNGSTWLWYATHGNFSPRLKIGYPVTKEIVFFFNYGHFYQYPDRDNYYRDPTIIQKDGTIGNPDLRPQKTISYEAGFQDQFTDDMVFKVNAFYKDIFDYPTFVPRGDVFLAYNLDYASARGFELIFYKEISHFAANLSYSYQIAKGRSSNPLATIFQPDYSLPRETRLDWDQNHTANVLLTYGVGRNEETNIFGLGINDYKASLTWTFGSGFPYNGYDGGRTTARNVYLVNSETKPYTSTFNLSLRKGFKLIQGINLSANLDVTNLFNRRNVIAVFNYTGKPYTYGDIDPDNTVSNITLPWRRAEYRLLYPGVFDAPRQVFLGISLNWD